MPFVGGAGDDGAAHGGKDGGGKRVFGLLRDFEDLAIAESHLLQAQGCGGFQITGETAVFALCLKEVRAVNFHQRLVLRNFCAFEDTVELIDPGIHIGGDDAMGEGVVIDGAGDLQGLAKFADSGIFGGDVEDAHLGIAEGEDVFAAGFIEALVAGIDRGELHAADGAAAGFVGFDPRVHGALVEERLFFSAAFRGLVVPEEKPSGGCYDECSNQDGEECFHGIIWRCVKEPGS